jgi:hypothetical protein
MAMSKAWIFLLLVAVIIIFSQNYIYGDEKSLQNSLDVTVFIIYL